MFLIIKSKGDEKETSQTIAMQKVKTEAEAKKIIKDYQKKAKNQWQYNYMKIKESVK